MTSSLPRNLEYNAVATALKKHFEVEFPKGSADKLSEALEALTEKQENIYKEVVDFVKTHQEATAKTLDTGTEKLENSLDQLNSDTHENINRLQRIATPEILQRHPQLSTNALSSQR